MDAETILFIKSIFMEPDMDAETILSIKSIILLVVGVGLLLLAWLAGRQAGWKKGYDAGQKNIRATHHVIPHHEYGT